MRTATTYSIGGLKERAAQKGLNSLYDAINNSGTSEFFTYLFYPRVSQLAMPRLVIRKLDEQLKLYFGIYAAFNGADNSATAKMGNAVNYLRDLINNYFQNNTALSITALRGQPIQWLAVNWGPTAGAMLFPTNTNPILPGEFSTRLSKHIKNGLFYINEQSITDYYVCLFNDFIKGTDIADTIERAYQTKTGKTLDDFIISILDSTAARAWVVSSNFELVDLSVASASTIDCNAVYAFNEILQTIDGKSALVMKDSLSAISGLRVGEKLTVTYFSNSAPNGYSFEISATVFRIDYAANTIIIDKILANPIAAGGQFGLGAFKFDCAATPVDPAKADLIMWLDVPGYQQPLFSTDRVSRYSKRIVFTRIAFYSSLEIIRNTPKLENNSEAARTIEITGQVYINGRYGYILDKVKYAPLAGAAMVAAIHITPQFAPIPVFVKSVKRENNGTYIATRLDNSTRKLDPDGVLPGYATLNTGQYVNTAGIQGARIGMGVLAILEIIASVITILKGLVGLIADIVAKFKGSEIGLGIPTPGPDFRTDNCKWADNTYTTLACLQDDGTWELFDTNYNHIGPTDAPTSPIQAGLGWLAAGAMVLFALGGIKDEKPRKKR